MMTAGMLASLLVGIVIGSFLTKWRFEIGIVIGVYSKKFWSCIKVMLLIALPPAS